MRPPLARRLADLFALLVALGICAWMVVETFQADSGAKALLLGLIASSSIGVAYRAGRAMLRDWAAPAETAP